jgi:tRNA nucleotidyltransferase (CCA-adding enzyme)
MERRSVVPRWEHFEHQADVGVRGIGRTMAEAFEQAAMAMVAVITDPARVTPQQAVTVRCEAENEELLLVDWLNGLLAEMSARRMLFGGFQVEIDGGRLRGTARGEAVAPLRHEPAVEVKGASYLGLKVGRDDRGAWVAQCVVDV